MDAILMYLVAGCFHVAVRFMLEPGRLASNRVEAGSKLYVVLGARMSPETLVLIQIFVGVFLWPVGVTTLVLRVIGFVR